MGDSDDPVLVRLDGGKWYLDLRPVPRGRGIQVAPNLIVWIDVYGRVVAVEGLGPIRVDPKTVEFWPILDAGILNPMPLSELEETT